MALLLNDQMVTDWLKKHMTSEETEICYVYGHQEPPLWLRLLIKRTTSAMFVKLFIIGLTKQRVLIMQLSKLLKEKNVKDINFSQIEDVTIENAIVGTGKIICLKLVSGEKYRIQVDKRGMGTGLKKQGENLQKICDFFQDFNSQKAK